MFLPRPQLGSIAQRGPRAAGCLAALALLVGGCDSLENARGTNSLLTVFSAPPPGEAARWATDPWNADRRAQGTLLLAARPFAGEPVYMALFRDRLGDPDGNVRVAAVRAIAAHGEPDIAVDLAGMMLDDPEPLVRLEAAKAMQRLHNPLVVPMLLRALRVPSELAPERGGEPDPRVRTEVADALGQYAEARVVNALIESLHEDRRLSVQARAAGSLSTLTGQDFGYDYRTWTAWFATVREPFAAQRAYVYPVFDRDRTFFEHFPLVPDPPNEPAASPVGLSPSPVASR
ncbi:MAG: HEAT repeat domain-containing protein [Phycisphaerales bacterium]|jgi:hypothetical protein|nr:HEAT repeat domain-containing protein [Phycisphaerales bacterium]